MYICNKIITSHYQNYYGGFMNVIESKTVSFRIFGSLSVCLCMPIPKTDKPILMQFSLIYSSKLHLTF